MALIVGESIILHKIFKNKDYDSKYILVLIWVLIWVIKINLN
jgi:hypothetical protein